MSYCFSRSSVKFWGQTGQKNHWFWLELSVLWLQLQVWMNRWLWNDAQSLAWYSRGALLFLKVIHQISRSHGTKSHRFWPELNVSGLQLRFEFTNGSEMMHQAWCTNEEVPYCFTRSSMKFQVHASWKINDLNPFWVRLLVRSQLSYPSDLPCFIFNIPTSRHYVSKTKKYIRFFDPVCTNIAFPKHKLCIIVKKNYFLCKYDAW